MSLYAKAIAALLGGLATWGATAASDNSISLVEWFGVLGVLGTAFAVFAVPNKIENDEGQTHIYTVLVAVVTCIIVIALLKVFKLI